MWINMKENDMLEQMFSAVAQLLGQREEAMLERIAALENKVEELERKLEEAAQAGAPVVVSVAETGEDVAAEDSVVVADEDIVEEDFDEAIAEGDFEEMVEEEDVAEEDYEEGVEENDFAEEDFEEVIGDDNIAEDVQDVELAGVGMTAAEEVVEAVDFDGDEEISQVEEIEGEEVDADGPAAESEVEIELEFLDDEDDIDVEDAEAEEIGDEEQVLVVDKARPDWYDWEVDIPGSYIEDIWDGIGLNDRLLFLKELFRGDEIDFSDTLDVLNEMTTLAEAVEFIRGRYPFWDEESDEVYRFYMTVRRRFNKQRQ